MKLVVGLKACPGARRQSGADPSQLCALTQSDTVRQREVNLVHLFTSCTTEHSNIMDFLNRRQGLSTDALWKFTDLSTSVQKHLEQVRTPVTLFVHSCPQLQSISMLCRCT